MFRLRSCPDLRSHLLSSPILDAQDFHPNARRPNRASIHALYRVLEEFLQLEQAEHRAAQDSQPNLPDSLFAASVPRAAPSISYQKKLLFHELRHALRSDDYYDFDTSDLGSRRTLRTKVDDLIALLRQWLEGSVAQRELYLSKARTKSRSAASAGSWGQRVDALFANLQDRGLSPTEFTEKLTSVHEGLEQYRKQDGVTAASADLLRPNVFTETTSAQGINQQQQPYQRLYECLTSRAPCEEPTHHALVPLGRFPDTQHKKTGVTGRLYLAACPPFESTQVGELHCSDDPYWHQTNLKWIENNQLEQHAQTDLAQTEICGEIHDNRKFQSPLLLHYDNSRITVASEAIADSLSAPLSEKGPKIVSLATLLRPESFRSGDAIIRQKKASLALNLALFLRDFYPGPWIQHSMDAKEIMLMYAVYGRPPEGIPTKFEDFDEVCISCRFERNWASTNKAWNDFPQGLQLRQHPPGFDDFFLSFAQILVDIDDELQQRHTVSPLSVRPSLLVKAQKMRENETMDSYGQAVQFCAQFPLFFHRKRREEMTKNQDPQETAQILIESGIVNKLRDNLARHAAEVTHPAHLHIPSCSLPTTLGSPSESYFTLFSHGDEMIQAKQPGDETPKNNFIDFHMRRLKLDFLQVEKRLAHRPVVIAVLDTGVHFDTRDYLLTYARENNRIVEKDSRDFLQDEPSANGWDIDKHGHGTHVVRVLLQCTANARIIVLRVFEQAQFHYTASTLKRLINALEWASKHADIINLSFGLDEAAKCDIDPVLNRTIFEKRKLIFAAASNSGGNGKRAYPASLDGVFAIHATDKNGWVGAGQGHINPPFEDSPKDNFATPGFEIPTLWDGKRGVVSGTSFATAIAAAIAANALEFIRLAPTDSDDTYATFSKYSGMRSLFKEMAGKKRDWEYVRLWKEGMFLKSHDWDAEKLQEKLSAWSKKLSRSSDLGYVLA